MSEHDEMATSESDGVGMTTVLVGAVALAIGAIAGIVVGFLSGSQTTPPPEPVAVVEEIVEEDVGDEEGEEDDLARAQARVAELEREVVDKVRAVSELEAEMDRRASKGAELVAELKQLKRDLANARSNLKKAVNEKEQLLQDLRMTEAELEQTRIQRDMAREDALFNRWQDFLKGSQLEICDKGRRKKIERCREIAMEALGTPDRRDRFSHCVRSGQAAPVIMELERNDEMPDFSEMINEDERATKGWMIVYCDPTLPERKDGRLAERHLPGAKIAEPPRPVASDDEDLAEIPPADAPE